MVQKNVGQLDWFTQRVMLTENDRTSKTNCPRYFLGKHDISTQSHWAPEPRRTPYHLGNPTRRMEEALEDMTQRRNCEILSFHHHLSPTFHLFILSKNVTSTVFSTSLPLAKGPSESNLIINNMIIHYQSLAHVSYLYIYIYQPPTDHSDPSLTSTTNQWLRSSRCAAPTQGFEEGVIGAMARFLAQPIPHPSYRVRPVCRYVCTYMCNYMFVNHFVNLSNANFWQ